MGRFQAHHDSSAFHPRLVSALFYLNDIPPAAGGETWFPFTRLKTSKDSQIYSTFESNLNRKDFATINDAIADALQHYQKFEGNNEYCKVSEDTTIAYHESLPGTKVRPVRGTALVFLNYLKSKDEIQISENNWRDFIDPQAVHAGLPVLSVLDEANIEQGQKWLANYWIEFDPSLLVEQAK